MPFDTGSNFNPQGYSYTEKNPTTRFILVTQNQTFIRLEEQS